MITWHYVKLADFQAADSATKTADKLYFIQETGEIYRGTQLFSQACEIVADFNAVTNKAVGRVYIHATTLEGKIWNGSAWQTVIQPVQAALTATDTALPVSGKAVADHVAAEINKVTNGSQLVKGVGYVAASNSLEVTMADGTSDTIEMTNVAADLVYDASTGTLQVKTASGTTIGTGVKLDLERFVKEASYDHESRKIYLTFNDNQDPLEIEMGDLVDTYTAANSSTVNLSVTGNQFTAEVIVAATADNLLVKSENGLYVAPVDLSGKMDRDTDAVEGNLAKFDANGTAVDAGLIAGGATLAATALSTTLATEAAVAAIRDALQTAIDGKMAKVASGKAGEVITATADGNGQVSGYTLGGETLGTGANVLATEKAVNTYVQDYAVAKTDIVDVINEPAAASDALVPSEKAVANAISWITTV